MHRIYLDNNATTTPAAEVLAAVNDATLHAWGNASSIHGEGRAARKRLETAREIVALLIGATANEIVFTSGGTESNNTALRGVVSRSGDRCRIVTTAIEHPSVISTVRSFEASGHETVFVPPRSSGIVDADELLSRVDTMTTLVSVMLANNETGAIQPVREIAARCRELGVHVHCDAVQAVGRIPVGVTALGVDTLSLSAHKMHGPKGAGALFVRHGTVLSPIMTGGAQERRRRAGTESVALAAGFAAAAELARAGIASGRSSAALRDRFERELLEAISDARISAAGSQRLPNTSSIVFPGCDAEGIVIALDLEGIAVSTGSACSSGRIEPSHVLLAMGLSEEDSRSAVRVSLGRMTTAEEIGAALDCFRRIVPRNRKHSGRSDVGETSAPGGARER